MRLARINFEAEVLMEATNLMSLSAVPKLTYDENKIWCSTDDKIDSWLLWRISGVLDGIVTTLHLRISHPIEK